MGIASANEGKDSYVTTSIICPDLAQVILDSTQWSIL